MMASTVAAQQKKRATYGGQPSSKRQKSAFAPPQPNPDTTATTPALAQPVRQRTTLPPPAPIVKPHVIDLTWIEDTPEPDESSLLPSFHAPSLLPPTSSSTSGSSRTTHSPSPAGPHHTDEAPRGRYSLSPSSSQDDPLPAHNDSPATSRPPPPLTLPPPLRTPTVLHGNGDDPEADLTPPPDLKLFQMLTEPVPVDDIHQLSSVVPFEGMGELPMDTVRLKKSPNMFDTLKDGVSLTLHEVMLLTMGVLVGVSLTVKGIVVEGEGFLDRIERVVEPEGYINRVLAGGHCRHRPRWGCPDESDSRVFMERCARAALRHPRYHPGMGDITVARRVALHYYLAWSDRLEDRRRQRARTLRAQLDDLGPFAHRAEANLLAQTPLEHMLPDLVVPGEWPRLAPVWPLYVKEPSKRHFAVRIPGWVDSDLLKPFMFLWAYNEERELANSKSTRRPRYFLPQAYWSYNVPTNALIPSYMLRAGITPPPNVEERARPVKAEYPRIFEQVRTTDDDRLKRAYTRYQRMFVTVHADDSLAATLKQERCDARERASNAPQEVPPAAPGQDRRNTAGRSKPKINAEQAADIKPDIKSNAAVERLGKPGAGVKGPKYWK